MQNKPQFKVVNMYHSVPKKYWYSSFTYKDEYYEYCGRPSKFGNYSIKKNSKLPKQEQVIRFNNHFNKNKPYYKNLLIPLISMNKPINLVCFCGELCHCNIIAEYGNQLIKEMEKPMNIQIKNSFIEGLLNTNLDNLHKVVKHIEKQYGLVDNYKSKILVNGTSWVNHKLFDIEFKIHNNHIVSVIPRIYFDETMKANTINVLDIDVTCITKDTFIPVGVNWEDKAKRVTEKLVYLHYKEYSSDELYKLFSYVKDKGYTKIYLGFDKTIDKKPILALEKK